MILFWAAQPFAEGQAMVSDSVAGVWSGGVPTSGIIGTVLDVVGRYNPTIDVVGRFEG